jgi:ABC-2 type transport system ATP-binding protein
MDAGRIRFDGTPKALAEVAAGKVWMSAERPSGARIFWRTAEGTYRGVGDPPSGSTLIDPAIEDGYLLLVGAAALEVEAA